jgi:hypothetical protein
MNTVIYIWIHVFMYTKESNNLYISVGQDHLVLADMGCRNTVFSAKAQSGEFYIYINMYSYVYVCIRMYIHMIRSFSVS